MNTKYKADIVITSSINRYAVWWKDDVIANTDEIGLHLVVQGAVSTGLSIYDEEKRFWLAGTFNQLAPIGEEVQ
jgi:hypothetical protein